MIKKVAIIGTVGLPAKYGGFESLAEYLTKNLSNRFAFTVYCSKSSFKERKKTHNNSSLKYLPFKANGVQSILYDFLSIIHAVFYSDCLLILGVSGCMILPLIRMFSSKKIIVNIDGVEWKRSKWNWLAKWFLKNSERIAIYNSDKIISDNKGIYDYLKTTYNVESSLISYGGDHTENRIIVKSTYDKYPFLKEKYAFKVCRIEPENNIELVIEAFKEYSMLNLVIVGNWENSSYGKKIKEKYFDFKNIFLVDSIYCNDLLNQIRGNCYLYIHGHSAGGTNPSLVEAMHLSLPIFCFDVIFNRETTENKSKYFKSKKDLIDLLNKIKYSNLSNISNQMKIIAEKKYKWKQICNMYSELF